MIYFCIPAYNEERSVGVVLWKLRQVMGELRRDYQIIVVDDASTDSTLQVLKPYIRVLPLTVIRNSKRLGYSDSLEIALREAVKRAPYPKRDTIITLQADFTEDPDVVPAMVKRIEAGADIVACDLEIEEATPRAFRWGRRLFRWLMRKHEWGSLGDPVSGLRAYRVMVLKRALEVRGNARLLSWKNWAANAELLMHAAPHSRRNEVVEASLKMHRHQRDSRYAFMAYLADVRGAASTKPNKAAPALPTEMNIITPEMAAASAAPASPSPRRFGGQEGRRSGGKAVRRSGGEQRERPKRERGERGERTERPRREKKPPRPAVALVQEEEKPAAETTEEPRKRKKRRPRRRKKSSSTQISQISQMDSVESETTSEVAETRGEEVPGEGEGVGEGAAKKKKSRRGRRGGRGRRRGPKREGGADEAPNDVPNDAPPDIAAEG